MVLRFLQKIEFVLWSILIRFSLLRVGKKFRIQRPLLITPDCIEVGDFVHIRRNARIEGVKFYNNIRYEPKILIGSNVTIEQNIHLTCAKRIVIGENTSIAANVTITDIDHGYTDVTIPVEKQNLIIDEVKIGRNSKIYNNAVILPGVQLNEHTVVGANSVVIKGQYSAFCVLAGTPARIVKIFDKTEQQWIKYEKN